VRGWRLWAILVVPRVWVSLRELLALEGTYARCSFTPGMRRNLLRCPADNRGQSDTSFLPTCSSFCPAAPYGGFKRRFVSGILELTPDHDDTTVRTGPVQLLVSEDLDRGRDQRGPVDLESSSPIEIKRAGLSRRHRQFVCVASRR